MADDRAKSDFSDILSYLKKKFEITDSKWTDNKIYEVKFRTQIAIDQEDYNKCCDQWVDQFSYITDTVWVHKISNTGPKVKFRKQYQCWTYESKEVNKDILFDARRCRATLDIKVLGDSLSTKGSNRYMRLGMNVLIKAAFHHLHPVDTSKDYSFFVHWCKPLPEAPKPAAPSNERVSQLVARVVQTAPITSQKAAERAREALKRQGIVPSVYVANEVVEACQTSNKQVATEPSDDIVIHEAPITQVIVSSPNGQSSENVIFLHQVVFDSATQTLREILPAPSNCNSTVNSLTSHQLLPVEIPGDTTQIASVVDLQSNGCQITEHF